jgi:hypothetical protein
LLSREKQQSEEKPEEIEKKGKYGLGDAKVRDSLCIASR